MANLGLNNSGLYTGGAVKLDSNPHTQLLINLMARQQVKNDALDEYYRKLPSTITTTGMNNNDIPAFNKSVADWQDHYMQNRAAILNPRLDGGKAQIQNQQLFRQAQSIPQESISEQKKIQPLHNMMVDPDKRDRFTDGLFGDIHAHDLPLYVQDKDGNLVRNPERKSIDLTKIDFEGKPFDLAKHDANFAHIPQSENTPQIVNDPLHPESQIVTTTKGYNQDAQKEIGVTSSFLYNNDSSFKKVIDDEIKKVASNPDDYNKYNSVYKNVFGTNLDITHPEQFAAAWDINRKLANSATQKVQPNESAKLKQQQAFELTKMGVQFGYNKKLEAIRHSDAKDLIKYRDDLTGGDAGLNNEFIENYINKTTDDARNSGTSTTYKYADGRVVEGNPIQLDPTMKKALGFSDKDKGELIATKDGKYIVTHFKTDEKYNPVVKDGSHSIESSETLTKDQVKMALGFKTETKKDLKKTMTSGNTQSTNTPSLNASDWKKNK